MTFRYSAFAPLFVAVALFSFTCGCKNKRVPEPDTKDEATPEVTQDMAPPTEPPKPKSLPAPSDVAAPPANAEKSATGLAWTVLRPGSGGDKPGPSDKVQVHYTGWTKDGTMFDSSEVRGEPTTFGVGQVIKGWTEGLQLMTKGEKRRFWIPPDLAYGEVARRPGAPSGQLTFDVELLDVLAAPKAPEDVAAPGPAAKKTASGLAYRVLTEGSGESPTESSRVTVHYSGWTKDGKLFDSSITRGSPASFAVTGVIKGWTEGLQLMKKGAKYRFWIPGELAYGDTPARPGSPAGQLTFDVELIDFQ